MTLPFSLAPIDLIWVVVAALIALWLGFNWAKGSKMILACMLFIEKTLPTLDGRHKMYKVVSKVYPMLPWPMRMWLTEEDLIKFAQKLYDLTKDYLDNGKVDGSSKNL